MTLASTAESEALVRDVLLRDGSTLRLQAPRPADFDDITEFTKVETAGIEPAQRSRRTAKSGC